MSSLRLVLRGLRGYWRTHLGALATAAIVTSVIVAALGVGDSVRAGLTEVSNARTGRVAFAAHARDRMWREDLAERLAERLDTTVSAALRLNGSIALPDGSARVAGVHVLGVDDAFWSLSPGGRPPLSSWPKNGIALSERAAAGLGAKEGDRVIVRVETPAPFSRDAPMSSDARATALIAAEVVAVLDAQAFGTFALEIGQVPPSNVFLPLQDLQDAVGEPGRAIAAPGMSAVVEVLLRKDERVFINDGMHGIFWELRYDGHNGFPVRTFRDGHVHSGETMPFTVNGPTCDSEDTLPDKVELPVDIRPGDHLEFGNIGAYSLSGRTDFNGYYSDHVVTITSESEYPPSLQS